MIGLKFAVQFPPNANKRFPPNPAQNSGARMKKGGSCEPPFPWNVRGLFDGFGFVPFLGRRLRVSDEFERQLVGVVLVHVDLHAAALLEGAE